MTSKKTELSTYWRSLNQLANNEEYKKFLHREFPENASELKDGMTRKNFLHIMGASIALAGLAACRRPVEKILPYRTRPEDMDPGNPLFYATAMPYRGALTGLVVKAREGRPIKIEGNNEHPASRGNTNLQQQASVLGLYDPDRSRGVTRKGQKKTWNDFVSFAKQQFTPDTRVAFLCEANSSLTLDRLKQQALKKFKKATWVTYEPYGESNATAGTLLAFGKKLRTFNHYDKAKVIVALDSNFLLEGAEDVVNIGNFARGRRVMSTTEDMSRLYSVEANYSLTGSNADHRLKLKQAEIEPFIFALAAELSKRVSGLEAYSGYSNKLSSHHWISTLVEDLINHKGESIVVTGTEQSPDAHAAVAAMNLALGNVNRTVSHYSVPHFDEGDDTQRFYNLVKDLKNGQYDALVMIGANPVYTAPADLDVASAIKAVKTSVQLSDYDDETAKVVEWHINKAHYLESWGDGAAFTGEISVIQPLIQPLFDGKSDIELLNAVVDGTDGNGYDMVQDTWKSILSKPFKPNWEKLLHDGIYPGTGYNPENVRISNNLKSTAAESLKKLSIPDTNKYELIIKPDPKILDGRYANIGWLQELPDQLTTVTWDNVALMSMKTAATIGVRNEDVIEISADGKMLKLAAWILPGHAENSITVYTGYGRTGIGRIANDNFGWNKDDNPRTMVKRNAFSFVTTANPLYYNDVKIKKTGELYPIAVTQDHGTMEGRAIVREANISEYRKNPRFAPEMVDIPGRKEIPSWRKDEQAFTTPLFDAHRFPPYEPQWGMAIDLNTCVGCGTCAVACQSENNVPVVGKIEVRKGREMSWIRVDRYYVGDTDNPKVVHQPIPCMQCELAPCEEVCPVAATTHSEDGLNQQTYNRCIGTRYCSNNCPYKVRRFNFFNYSREFLTTGKDPEIVQMAMNPNVTVRFRGVMEKCTYCVQRIKRAKIETRNKTNSYIPPEGMVKTACQQACPADAIVFGLLNKDDTEVVKQKLNDRNYLLLGELNTRPRTSYLAKLRNPNEKMV